MYPLRFCVCICVCVVKPANHLLNIQASNHMCPVASLNSNLTELPIVGISHFTM